MERSYGGSADEQLGGIAVSLVDGEIAPVSPVTKTATFEMDSHYGLGRGWPYGEVE